MTERTIRGFIPVSVPPSVFEPPDIHHLPQFIDGSEMLHHLWHTLHEYKDQIKMPCVTLDVMDWFRHANGYYYTVRAFFDLNDASYLKLELVESNMMFETDCTMDVKADPAALEFLVADLTEGKTIPFACMDNTTDEMRNALPYYDAT